MLHLLMFIQTCSEMWQRNKAFNTSAVCATHKRLKLLSNSTCNHQHYYSVQLVLYSLHLHTPARNEPHYACYKHSTPRTAIPQMVEWKRNLVAHGDAREEK